VVLVGGVAGGIGRLKFFLNNPWQSLMMEFLTQLWHDASSCGFNRPVCRVAKLPHPDTKNDSVNLLAKS
jgi:hypothetical protein